MRSLGKLVILLAVASLLVACDSDQPLQVGTQTLAINFFAINASGPQAFAVTDGFADSNPEDGEPDDVDNDGQPDIFLHCVSTNINLTASTVPWNFGVQVEVIRAGNTVRETVSPPGSFNNIGGNLTQYARDEVDLNFALPDVRIGAQVFKFRNPRVLTAAHRDVVAATENPLYDIDPVQYGLGNGLCSLSDPGPAGIAGEALPFEIQVSKGDTVIVTAVRGNVPPMDVPVSNQPQLAGSMTLDGRSIVPTGNTTSSTDPSAGISFSFTIR